ncbi:MAG: phosphoribosyltransferase [Rickettsiales bacterium]
MSKKLKVITLDQKEFTQAARGLNDAVFVGFKPDVIVGIRTGGYILAEIMSKEAGDIPLLAISKQRASTKTKSKVKGLKNLLGSLPYCITDQLRIVEHKKLNSKPPIPDRNFVPNHKELEELRNFLKNNKIKNILIVDDAVDSGATMLAVYELIYAEAGEECSVKTAAITVTTENPLIKTDYTLYQNVLCRLPWSFDFKK